MTAIAKILEKHQPELLQDWLKEQKSSGIRLDLIRETDLQEQSRRFLSLLQHAVAGAESVENLPQSRLADLKGYLFEVARTRAIQGFSPSEVAMFIFSVKRPLFQRLRNEVKDQDSLFNEMWGATKLLDGLGLITTEAYQKAREEVISRQQEELLELSTPVVKLWEGVLALPMIGTLDSNRTQVVMESLLQRIVETGSEIAIIDITGVPTVDTLTAQYLIKTVTAARLMGADCIISGIRPQIAQTIVHLGVALGDVITKATLADAFIIALQRTGFSIHRKHKQGQNFGMNTGA